MKQDLLKQTINETVQKVWSIYSWNDMLIRKQHAISYDKKLILFFLLNV